MEYDFYFCLTLSIVLQSFKISRTWDVFRNNKYFGTLIADEIYGYLKRFRGIDQLQMYQTTRRLREIVLRAVRRDMPVQSLTLYGPNFDYNARSVVFSQKTFLQQFHFQIFCTKICTDTLPQITVCSGGIMYNIATS